MGHRILPSLMPTAWSSLSPLLSAFSTVLASLYLVTGSYLVIRWTTFRSSARPMVGAMNRKDRIMVSTVRCYVEVTLMGLAAGGKRPLSSSCPYIVEDGRGDVVLAGGCAGGSRIISSNVQVVRNVLVGTCAAVYGTCPADLAQKDYGMSAGTPADRQVVRNIHVSLSSGSSACESST